MDNNKWRNNFLNQLREEYTTYRDMVDFCTNGALILNNSIQGILEEAGFCFDDYCGNAYDEDNDTYADIYQQYIITADDALRFAEYTNEIVIYCEDAEIYLLCVTHFGTSWDGVPANWRDLND